MTGPKLSDLDDDILIHVFGYLEVKDILRMRRTSSRFATISQTRVVWTRALTTHVLSEGLPFPPVCVDTTPTPILEGLVIRALKLTHFWLHPSPSPSPEPLATFSACSGTSVSEVRFIPARPNWVITVTRGIWPLITCWDFMSPVRFSRATRIAEWFRRGALFTGIVVNTDSDAEACLAVSLSYAGYHCVEVLAIHPLNQDGEHTFVSLASVETTFRAMSLQGDILVVSDDVNETHILNWRTNESAILYGSDEPSEHNFQHNRCLQVLFAEKCVFVVRARSFEAFPIPPLLSPENASSPQHPLACHRFGWLDGVAVTEEKQLPGTTVETNVWPPISILLRAESDDPWSSDVHTLDLYTLDPNPTCALPPPPAHAQDTTEPTDAPAPHPAPTTPPYHFPPRHTASFPSARGHLRCTDIRLGARGTAIWIQPRPARGTLGLTALDVHASDAQGVGVHPLTGARVVAAESLVAALLPGVLRDRRRPKIPKNDTDKEENTEAVGEEGGVRVLMSLSSGGSWTSVDYDEARGLVALGESTGGVTVLRLE